MDRLIYFACVNPVHKPEEDGHPTLNGRQWGWCPSVMVTSGHQWEALPAAVTLAAFLTTHRNARGERG